MNEKSSHEVVAEGTDTVRPGMGANLEGTACRFRVWAPHADRVSVVGSFNDWNSEADLLKPEGFGYWAGIVEGAAYRDEYKFAIHNGLEVLLRNDPYAREMTNSDGNSVIINPDFDWGDTEGYRTPPWNEWVIYEMHIGTFNDSPCELPGTFDRAIEKLDYLANELGVNCIELMPAAEFPGARSWGYNPAHLFAIERDYGGPKALRRFVKAAHERGIAVVLDVVFNHLGPTDIDLWQFDGWSDFGHSGGIYIYDDNRAHTPWGHTRPDYGRGEVRQMLRDNALFWLEEFRLDGLRFDATAYIRSVSGFGDDLPDGWGVMQWINDEVDARQPWKLMIAEDLRNDDWITRDTSTGGAGFDSQWSANFVHTVRHSIVTPDDTDRDMVRVANAIQSFHGEATDRVIYTESHDEVANGQARVAEEIWPRYPDSWFSRKRSTLGAAVVLTSPGIPMLFQGQEFLEDRWFADTDPLDWSRCERYAGIVQLYRDLIRLRRNWFDNTRGLAGNHVNVHHVNNVDKILAMHRWDDGGAGDDVVVVFNFSNREFKEYRIGLPSGGTWKLRANTDAAIYDVDFGEVPAFDTHADELDYDRMPFSGGISLPPYSALIFSQDK